MKHHLSYYPSVHSLHFLHPPSIKTIFPMLYNSPLNLNGQYNPHKPLQISTSPKSLLPPTTLPHSHPQPVLHFLGQSK